MQKHFFLAGTDTDVGKTVVSCALLRQATAAGLSTLGLKPIAAGCEKIDGEYRNDDALALMASSTASLPYKAVNPIAFADPIAPHIAAMHSGVSVSASDLANQCQQQLVNDHFTIIEGAGGWRVPLNDTESMADLARVLGLPVILVVGFKLGCLNHALLTVEAITRDGLPLAGWVANQIDPDMAVVDENLASLKQRINAPCLGFIPYRSNITAEAAQSFLNSDFLYK